MGSCAAPSAKGDDKFITTDYLQQCQSAGAKRRCPAECRQSFAGTVKAARPERPQQALPLTLTSDIRH
ncbi:hypothetical protein EY723_29105 [Klebsiella pneumoniae]|nr:hypothetical protein EY722_29030 [Klebsiella pneumoniae]KAA6251552.1 hypothetical protein EY723_29105 [Klebsiella pneumoniae]KAA6259766.1 hypothetical protein EY724_28755 [Klebsiella pneumoniae]